MEPPPSVLRADKLRTGQIRGRMKTGAKTATKDQERDYLERFQRLADDPSPLVPRWAGSGSDPFSRIRARLARVQKKQASGFWLKWYARGKGLEAAYANTLIILRGGKIPSFAAFKFRGRDVRFIMRGRGLRDKLIAVQNFEEPDLRLLAFLDAARKFSLVIVSLDDDFLAFPKGGAVPAGTYEAILSAEDVETAPGPDGVRCPHADGTRAALRYTFREFEPGLTLCRACLERLGKPPDRILEAHVLPPGGRFTMERALHGTDLHVHPESARQELEGLLRESGADALERMKSFEGVTELVLLDWAHEALQKRLDGRPTGFLLMDKDLWLGEFEEAAKRFGETDLERRLLHLAFGKAPPRLRTADASVNRLLENHWKSDAAGLLRELAAGALEERAVEELAAQRPSDALATLQRHLKAEERFAGYPRFADLGPPLQLAYDLFKAVKTGDNTQFQQRLAAGVRDPAAKPAALALARAFSQSAGIEWQYAPHEKDQALYLEPAARELSRADAGTLHASLSAFAQALGTRPPVPIG